MHRDWLALVLSVLQLDMIAWRLLPFAALPTFATRNTKFYSSGILIIAIVKNTDSIVTENKIQLHIV